MATTTYNVFQVQGDERKLIVTKSKKQTAVDAARSERQAAKGAMHVLVETGAGTVVLDLPAKKTIKMSPQFTRVVELDPEFEIPEGHRVAYIRARKNVALLHDGESYSLFDYVTGEFLETELPTTRAAGQAVKAIPVPAKA